MGNDIYNENLVGAAVWVIDDNEATTDAKIRRRFSEKIKKYTASSKLRVRGMYKSPVDLHWQGRIVMTTNTDAASLSILPDLDGSILDKLMILRLKDSYNPWFKTKGVDPEKVIRDELPSFLAWLLKYTPPEYITKGSDPRFGINPHHDVSLLDEVRSTAPAQQDLEFLEVWWDVRGSKEIWTGTAAKLLSEMSIYDTVAPLIRGTNSNYFGKVLSKVAEMGDEVTKEVRGKKAAVYSINFG